MNYTPPPPRGEQAFFQEFLGRLVGRPARLNGLRPMHGVTSLHEVVSTYVRIDFGASILFVQAA